ncbi:MAG: universal stress protein [Myxococcales bacterium]|nr:universal stress protein [Myxococcales bacterium]
MKKILVGLDSSERASDVLQVACDVAAAHGAKLTLFRAVFLPSGYPPRVLSVLPDALPGILEHEARVALTELMERVPAAHRGGVKVATGTAWQQLCMTALSDGVDLVVIGSHGYHGVDKVLGTTAARVVNHAPCSVLIVRSKALFHDEPKPG